MVQWKVALPQAARAVPVVRLLALLGASASLYWWPDQHAGYDWTFWLWLASGAAFAWTLDGPGQRTARPALTFVGGLLAIVAFALLVRLPYVAELPSNISIDEVLPGYEALRIAQGRTGNVFSGVGWFTIPNLSFALPAVVMRMLPDDTFLALRLSSVLTGVLGIVGTALLARRLFGDGIALTSAFLMAAGFWHVHNSRTGFPFVQTSFAVAWVLYALVRARQTHSLRGLLVAGMVLGFSLQLYFPVRILLLLVPLFLLVGWIGRGDSLRRVVLESLVFGAGAAFALAPLVTNVDSALLLGRSQGVLLTRPAVFEELSRIYGVQGVPAVVLRNAQESLAMLSEWADVCILNRSPHGLFDQVTLAAIALGALVAICQARTMGLLLLAWIGLVFVLGVALTDAPRASYRLGPAMPAFYMLAGFGIHATLLAVRPGPLWYRATVLPAVFAAFASSVVLENYDSFFVDYVRKGDGREMPASASMRYAGARCPGRNIYFLASPEPLGREPMLDVFCPRHVALVASEIPDRVDASEPATFIVMSWQRESLERLQQCYPGVEPSVQRAADGRFLFTSMEVEPEMLAIGRESCPREPPRKSDALGAQLGESLRETANIARRAVVPRPR